MSEDGPTAQGAPAATSDIADLLPMKQDWLLADLVKIVNAIDIEFGISLTISSGIATGTLISSKTYHRMSIDNIETNNPRSGDAVSALHVVADYYGETMGMYKEIDVNEGKLFEEPANFVHLKNARIYLGGNMIIPSSGGVLWRGRLSEVQGYFLGELSTDKA